MAITLSTTDKEYHDNKEFWGEHQFISLQNIIDNIELTASQDSFFKKFSRHAASIYGKQGIKRMNVDIKPKPRAVSFQVGPSKTFPYPRFMMNWHRVSMVNDCGKLIPINIKNDPVTRDYLQGHKYELLYDNNGDILEGKSKNYNYGECVHKITCCCDDTSLIEDPEYWVKGHDISQQFIFSDNLYDKEVVIEFRSSGLDSLNDCDILVHSDLELTLTHWIEWNLMRSNKNMAQSRIDYVWNLYKLEKKRSKRLLGNKISLNQILESMSQKYR